jgi:hypothetical protein
MIGFAQPSRRWRGDRVREAAGHQAQAEGDLEKPTGNGEYKTDRQAEQFQQRASRKRGLPHNSPDGPPARHQLIAQQGTTERHTANTEAEHGDLVGDVIALH